MEEQPPVSWKTPGNPWFSYKKSLQPIDWVSKYQVIFEKIRHVDAAKIAYVFDVQSFFFGCSRNVQQIWMEIPKRSAIQGGETATPTSPTHLMVQKQLLSLVKRGWFYHWVDQITIYIYIYIYTYTHVYIYMITCVTIFSLSLSLPNGLQIVNPNGLGALRPSVSSPG